MNGHKVDKHHISSFMPSLGNHSSVKSIGEMLNSKIPKELEEQLEECGKGVTMRSLLKEMVTEK